MENDKEETRMNGDLGGETELLELEAHEEILNAHPNISEQDIVTHEDNERIREERDKPQMKTMEKLFQKVQ